MNDPGELRRSASVLAASYSPARPRARNSIALRTAFGLSCVRRAERQALSAAPTMTLRLNVTPASPVATRLPSRSSTSLSRRQLFEYLLTQIRIQKRYLGDGTELLFIAKGLERAGNHVTVIAGEFDSMRNGLPQQSARVAHSRTS